MQHHAHTVLGPAPRRAYLNPLRKGIHPATRSARFRSHEPLAVSAGPLDCHHHPGPEQKTAAYPPPRRGGVLVALGHSAAVYERHRGFDAGSLCTHPTTPYTDPQWSRARCRGAVYDRPVSTGIIVDARSPTPPTCVCHQNLENGSAWSGCHAAAGAPNDFSHSILWHPGFCRQGRCEDQMNTRRLA
jgi:hypothetical protein